MNSDCVNTEGSFTCSCHAGFELAGTHRCADINECSIGTHTCDPLDLATCMNTVGSFQCACPTGFVGAGTTDDPCSAECDAQISDATTCMDSTTCYETCNTYMWKLADHCPTDLTECVRGCFCHDGFVHEFDAYNSSCVNETTCPDPECPVNEAFSRCGPNCYRDCDNENPVCDDNCAAGCNCAEGFIKPSAGSTEACIPEKDCKLIVDLTCGLNEHFVEEFDRCHLMCENVRIDTNRTDCLPDGRPNPGCECNAGFTRLTSDPHSPCVPTGECVDTYDEVSCESFNLMEIVQSIPLRVDLANRRTWYHLTQQFADVGYQEALKIFKIRYLA